VPTVPRDSFVFPGLGEAFGCSELKTGAGSFDFSESKAGAVVAFSSRLGEGLGEPVQCLSVVGGKACNDKADKVERSLLITG